MNLADLVRHHGRRRPAHPAIVARDRTWSYADLDAAVDTAAMRLLERGVKQGDLVGIALGDTPEHLAFLFGIARAGAVILPMDKRWTEAEKQRVAVHFGAKLTLIDQGDLPIEGVTCESVETPLKIDRSAKPPESPRGTDLGFVLSLSSGT